MSAKQSAVIIRVAYVTCHCFLSTGKQLQGPKTVFRKTAHHLQYTCKVTCEDRIIMPYIPFGTYSYFNTVVVWILEN